MQQFKDYWTSFKTQLFKWFVPIFTLAVAVLGVYFYFSWPPNFEFIVMALLGLLVIDIFVQRIGWLDNIEGDVKELKDLISVYNSGHISFNFRYDEYLPNTDELITKANEEIWISGIALDSVAGLTESFERQIKEKNIKVRFIALKPEEEVIKSTCNYLGEEADDLRRRLGASLNKLYSKLINGKKKSRFSFPKKSQKKVKLKTIGHRPAFGYFIVDPNQEDGFMTVESYISKSDKARRPIFRLSRKADTEWFNIYLQDFRNLWETAEEWSPSASTVNEKAA